MCLVIVHLYYNFFFFFLECSGAALQLTKRYFIKRGGHHASGAQSHVRAPEQCFYSESKDRIPV